MRWCTDDHARNSTRIKHNGGNGIQKTISTWLVAALNDGETLNNERSDTSEDH